MIEDFRKSDESVEVVDTGSLRSDNELRPRAKSDDTLSFIAHSTRGEVSQATSSVQDSVNRMLERSSVTYVLWFEPRGLKEDGAVHKLTVKLRNPEKGIRIYSRPSYTAPKAGAEQDDTERRLEAASLIVGDRDAGDIRLSVLAAPFASTGDGAFVTVILEAEGSGLLRGHSGAALPVVPCRHQAHCRGLQPCHAGQPGNGSKGEASFCFGQNDPAHLRACRPMGRREDSPLQRLLASGVQLPMQCRCKLRAEPDRIVLYVISRGGPLSLLRTADIMSDPGRPSARRLAAAFTLGWPSWCLFTSLCDTRVYISVDIIECDATARVP